MITGKEFIQKLYSENEEKDKKKKSSSTEKALGGVAIVSGAASMAGGFGIYKESKKIKKLKEEADTKTREIAKKHGVDYIETVPGVGTYKAPANHVVIKDGVKLKTDKDIINENLKRFKDNVSREIEASSEQRKMIEELQKKVNSSNKRIEKLSKGSKAALGIGATALAVGTGMKVYRHYRNKKKDKE